MRISILFLLSFISPILAIRFLFASDIHCVIEDIFRFNISYWDKNVRISTIRELSARKSLFFYHEGAEDKMWNPVIRAWITHNCTDDGNLMNETVRLPIEDIDKKLHRIDYKFVLGSTEEFETVDESEEEDKAH